MPKLHQCHKAALFDSDHSFICDVGVELGSFITLIFPEEITEGSWENVHVVFYDNTSGLVTCQCTLNGYTFREKNLTANCTIVKQEDRVQRRNDLKVQLDIPITLRTADHGTTPLCAKGMIKNISAGGIFVIPECTLEEGQIFTFIFDQTGSPVELECKVLRSQLWEEMSFGRKKETLGYGCKFIHLPESTETALRSYVFQQDLQKRKNDFSNTL